MRSPLGRAGRGMGNATNLRSSLVVEAEVGAGSTVPGSAGTSELSFLVPSPSSLQTRSAAEKGFPLLPSAACSLAAGVQNHSWLLIRESLC